MEKKIFTFFLALAASVGTFANSFTGFAASMDNKMGNQIYTQGLIQNTYNITLVETDATKHQYNINLTNGGTGTFQMGGVTFSYTNSEAGKTAYKTYDYYIQPNGVDREITIPTVKGEQVKIILREACAGILVNGVSCDFVEGENILTATGNSIVLKNSSAKPKINSILPGSTPTPDSNPDYEYIKIGDLYYDLYTANRKAKVIYNQQKYTGDITIPASVTYDKVAYRVTDIGDAFLTCRGLTSVTIPNSVTNIGSNAFNGCSGLTSVIIPNSVISIGSDAFRGCTGLTSITIGNSVTSIGNWAFFGCSSLTSVTIPNSVTSIGESVFDGCSSLTSVTVEAEIPPTVGDNLFYNYNNCPIYIPCGTLETYQNAEGWSNYASRIIYAHYPSYIINKKATNGYISTTSTEFTICDKPLVECTANPNSGCYFVRWADGNTENPRTIELTQDTTMEAIFDYLLEGKCGKDSALTWTFEPASMALNITDEGALSENYTYGTFMESLTIGNGITQIGQSAFAECTNLKKVIIGSSVKVLDEYAFYGCSAIESIICYSQRPPTVNQNALYGLDYGTIVYVPADYLNTYKMHDAWGLYDVRPIGAKSTQTDNVQVTPQENTADIVWPAVSGAATYELVIKDKQGNIICTLIFNAQGQLTQLIFHAPAANGKQMPEQTMAAGFSFTITGLNQGTTYNYTITSKDDNGNVLDTKSGTFTTNGATGIEDVIDTQHLTHPTKVLIDGAVYIIMPDGRRYNLQGAEVR